jgi:uncharacterized membrane protein
MSYFQDLREMFTEKYPFGPDDFFQQVLGSIILISPFIFTEEVWRLAGNMGPLNTAVALLFTFAVGHGVLYKAKNDRDWDRERKIFGLTVRYISLMIVAFGTIALMVIISGAHETFNAGFSKALSAVSLISIFSVIGAAVTDSLI